MTQDAFQRAVDDARRQLGISVSELLRRAGFPEHATAGGGLTRKGARRHLEPSSSATPERGHIVPPDVVRKLAAVLPISEEDLQRAAHVAAGFTTQVSSGAKWEDIPTMVARYMGDETVTEQEKQDAEARLLAMIAERRRPR